MKKHGLLLKDELVRAVLDGTKTQTRRPPGHRTAAEVGDLLWVREAWKPEIGRFRSWVHYRAGGCENTARLPQFDVRDDVDKMCAWIARSGGMVNGVPALDHKHTQRWFPSIHMPTWACRLTLRVAAVRAERVDAISEADALAEGFAGTGLGVAADEVETARGAFLRTWADIYGDTRGDCWVYTFEVEGRPPEVPASIDEVF